MITGAREKDLLEAANLLLNARRTHTPIADLPPALQPASLEEVAPHPLVPRRSLWRDRPGWKIGAPSADATPFFAPMPRAWSGRLKAVLYGPAYRYRTLEAEIAFLLGSDLPAARAQPLRARRGPRRHRQLPSRHAKNSSPASSIPRLPAPASPPSPTSRHTAPLSTVPHVLTGAPSTSARNPSCSPSTAFLLPGRAHRLQHLRRPEERR